MFNKILIANRGEIAVRIIRSAKEMGIKTVALYSEIDKESIHVQMADEAYCIGENYPHKSYLNLDKIKEAILNTKCDAVHPGYGFLSENPHFAKLCEELDVKFIGPESSIMNKLSNKFAVKKILMDSDIPVIPGSKNIITTESELHEGVKQLGFPFLIKAAFGGGGRGIKLIDKQEEILKAFYSAKKEALVAFGKDEVYIEKVVPSPRHIEVQIVADNYGNIITLGERDCSLQRRHQKILEESLSPVLNCSQRKTLYNLSQKITEILNYKGVGTLEFLYDGKNFYFMEINKRIQVEHPLTEVLFNVDLIKEQIKIAANEKLSVKEPKVENSLHSIECRINAENPFNFTPSPGTITKLYIPGGNNVRVDTAVQCGAIVPPYYDSLIAKVIAFDSTREGTRKKMLRALDEFIVEGIETTVEFHKRILSSDDFINGNYDVNYLDRNTQYN